MTLFSYKATHVSVNDYSDAMLVQDDGNTITLINENGDIWTDPISKWKAL